MKKAIKKIVKTILIGFFMACFLIVCVQRIKGQIPTLFNHSIFIILTDSMTPDYKPDDVILVRHKDPSKIKEGDVITYQGVEEDYAGKIITHKVVEEPQLINGVYYFQTQGTKEGAPLDPQITEEEVIGVVVTKLRVITVIYSAITNIYGFIFIIVVPMFAILIMQLIQLNKNNEKEVNKHAEEIKQSSKE